MSLSLKDTLDTYIMQQGSLELSQWLTHVLYHPAGGYYNSHNPFGPQGDYITAPEISQIFGELIAMWFIDAWHQANQPKRAILMELGPGQGTLMADMLRTIQHLSPKLWESLQVCMVECSPYLRQLQQDKLKIFSNISITWQETIPKLAGFHLIIGNEFFDALPIQQTVYQSGNWYERHITSDSSGYAFCLGPQSVAPLLPPLNLSDNLIYETSPLSNQFADQLGDILQQEGGVILIIDYGDDCHPRFGETLQALYRHHHHSPLTIEPLGDITHHVDFHQLKEVFLKYNLHTFGIQGQGNFLTQLGIEHRTAQLCKTSLSAPRVQLASYRLCAPAEMGQLFKVFAITSLSNFQPIGFS